MGISAIGGFDASHDVRGSRRRLVAVIAITAGSAAVTMALGQRIWTPPPGSASPPTSLVPLFAALEAFGDILFGLGVSFVIFGYGLVARAGRSRVLTHATYVSIAWLMLNWWPHGNLHRITVGGDW